MEILILGAECGKCDRLLGRVENIVHKHLPGARVEKITDTEKNLTYGMCPLPALVINGRVVTKGYVPGEEEILNKINEFLPEAEKIALPSKKRGKLRLAAGLVVLGLLITAVVIATCRDSFFSERTAEAGKEGSPPLSLADSVNLLYNYSLNGKPYRVTFLEFGSTGCRECKKMEAVMEQVKQSYAESVQVVFLNVRLPENKRMTEHFGISLIPVQVLLDRNGKEYFRHLGFCSFDTLSVAFNKKIRP